MSHLLTVYFLVLCHLLVAACFLLRGEWEWAQANLLVGWKVWGVRSCPF